MTNVTRPGNALMSGALSPEKRRLEPPRGKTKKWKDIWSKLVADYEPDYFRRADVPVMAAYIDAVILHDRATKQLSKEDLVVTDPNSGKPVPHPLISIVRTADGMLAMLATKLRAVPSARTAKNVVGNRMTKHSSEPNKPEGEEDHNNGSWRPSVRLN